jgi:putative hydroxymethylpyrimidine transport system substrate-binding protein
VIGAFRNFELNQMDIAKRPGRAFYPEENGVPTYDELIYVAHRDNLGDKRMIAFLGAVEQGVQYLLNHPEESWKLFRASRPARRRSTRSATSASPSSWWR